MEFLGQDFIRLTFFQQSKMVKFNVFFHGCYAIKLMVCNEALPTFCVNGQDFKRSNIIVVNNKPHNLVLKHDSKLITIHLKDELWLPS
jgi:hypothetical protein